METSPQHSMQPQIDSGALEPLLASARQARLNRTGITAIAEMMKSGGFDARAAIHAAVMENDGHAATVLIVGATMNGYRPEAGELVELFPLLANMSLMAPLTAWCTGDRLKMLVDVLESGRLSWQRQAFGILLAVELLGEAPPPPRLLTQMRLLARENLTPEAGIALGLAAHRIQDPATREVARFWMDIASMPGAESLLSSTRQLLAQMPVDALSDEQMHPFAGATLRRAAPKIGRNDPCPCGSGRKYKKCCAEKDGARLADPSPVAGVTMSEYLAEPENYLDRERFHDLSVREIARLDFSRLETLCVIDAVRELSRYRFWTEAESAVDELSSRADLPGHCHADGYRAELIDEALMAGARDVAQRQAAKVEDPQILESMHIALELLAPGPETLARLEKAVFAGMRDREQDRIIDLAHSLLDQYPALGILCARGALDPDRALDMEVLLEDVERARDRLQLPPGDMAHDLYEYLIDRDLDSIADGNAENPDVAAEKLAVEAAEQRARFKEASAKVALLEKRLRAQEEMLRKTTAERVRAGQVAQPEKPSEPALHENEEIKRLRGKVAELKGLIAESHRERSALRVRLAEATAKVDRAVLEPKRDPGERRKPDSEEPFLDSAELEADRPGRWNTLVPSFKNAARDAIRGAPAQLARSALQTAAALAAGDQAAWSGIKRLTAIPEVWSARIGLHYRLLFRLDTARATLEVTAFIHRRDLESAIARGGL